MGLMAAVAAVTVFVSAAFGLFGVFSGRRVDAVLISIPFIVVTILNAPILMSRSARDWFRCADRFRSEFRQQVLPR